MFWTSSLFFIKENWIRTISRHHAEPNINISLTRNFPFDPDVRQWSHLLMIPFRCLWITLNSSTRAQFECDVTREVFVCSNTRWSCCSVVWWRFQVVQIKQVDYKTSIKKVNSYKKSSWYFWKIAHKTVKCHKKAYHEASTKLKEVEGKPGKINELILKTKANLKEGPGNI